MKECEVKEAVDLAKYVASFKAADDDHFDAIDACLKLAHAVIALDNDDVCDDDDDDEPTFEIGPTFGDRVAQSLFSKTTVEDEEVLLPEPEPEPPFNPDAWPPWGAAAVAVDRDQQEIHLFGVDTQNFHLGMRVGLGEQSMKWYARLYRWARRRNWRVFDIKGTTVYLERSR